MTAPRIRRPGALAIVLHTHMPYVEGFGTWPFGEEWLFEAVATSYLPLLDVLDDRVTLSLTPVLADQLEAPGAMARCREFLETVRPVSHGLDIEHFAWDPPAVRELERSAAEYAAAAAQLAALSAPAGSDRASGSDSESGSDSGSGSDPGSGLLGALGADVGWTSSATHAILPLLCLDEAIELQLATAVASHRRRFGEWGGGFWLPECAYAPWLDGHLADAGVHHSCIELAGVDPRRPLATPAGPLLWPIDRAVIDLVWGSAGYPAAPEYRAYARLTPHHHRLWANDGVIYDPARAAAAIHRDAAHFVATVQRRLAHGGVCVFAIDTELLGHWWYEGPQWLAAVLAEAERTGLAISRLEQIEGGAPAPLPEGALAPISWGAGGDLRTWSSGPAADLAFRLRSAELRALATSTPSPRALRELLAAQASDWAFLEYRGWAGDYARERALGHLSALDAALTGRLMEPALRHLAPDLSQR
jgi:1,4-alpha-glucan branching enzyme